jgi:DNA replication and repair protein RecF
MIIKKITLKNFRNYSSQEIEFSPGVNIITGENGQGKTNLLEGICLLSVGKSFRTLNDKEMIKFGEESFLVKGEFEKEDADLTVGMKLSQTEKTFFVNGAEKKKNADLLENVYTVIFAPEDLRIVKEDPKKRRSFMDRELFQLRPMYYIYLSHYRKALKNRNILLKEELRNEGLIEIYDGYLAESGAKIIKERSFFIEKLNEICRKIGENITSGKEEILSEYDPNIDVMDSEEEQKEYFKECLRRNREKDLYHRTTTAGPHKDDIKITLNGTDLRKYGSQGQSRTAALSLKLAELRLIKEETGEEAILVLDDVLSELDDSRQERIINLFEDNQLFISAAENVDPAKIKGAEKAVYSVLAGNITKL